MGTQVRQFKVFKAYKNAKFLTKSHSHNLTAQHHRLSFLLPQYPSTTHKGPTKMAAAHPVPLSDLAHQYQTELQVRDLFSQFLRLTNLTTFSITLTSDPVQQHAQIRARAFAGIHGKRDQVGRVPEGSGGGSAETSADGNCATAQGLGLSLFFDTLFPSNLPILHFSRPSPWWI
jgi:hypothetical protein